MGGPEGGRTAAERGVQAVKKIAIVGAGVAGMAAGIYAQKSGFQTIICE